MAISTKRLPIVNPVNRIKYPNCYDGYQYALDIVAGKINASIYTIGACKRFLKEVGQENQKWRFDYDKAERYLRIAQQFKHVKGKWKNPHIIFEPWQKWVWMNIEGFRIKDTGFRRFRFAHIDVARGNGKSSQASIAVLFNLSLDSPLGNRVSTVATTKDQARLVFDDARAMAEGNKAFLRKTKCEVQKHKIIHEDSNSEARPLSAEASNLDGLNDVLAVCDELHAMKREVFEVITSGMSKRFDSLVLSITTAGDDDSSVGFAENQYAKAICLGHVKDDSRFAVVYTLDKDDNIYDPEVWIKANPNWGVSVDPETFKSKIYKTLEEPRDLPNVKIKHLNIWTSEEHSYFDVNKWDKCADPDLTFDKVKHLPCMAAIDLAQYKDLSSRGYVFYDKEADLYYVLEKTYVPSKVLNTKIASDFYNGWVEEGYLNTHEGEVMNFAQFGDELEEECKDLVIGKVAYDKWSAVELAQRKSDVLDMVEFAQSKQNFSEPTKKFDALIKSKQIRHNGSPLLRWCLSNVVVDEDSNSNVKPRKPTNDEKKKVDPIIAIIMALALWINDDTVGSVYEERGLLTI